MPCTLTIAVLSENQEGNVGKDWKYTLEAKVFAGALVGQGALQVPEHLLASGETRTPGADARTAIALNADAGAKLNVELHLVATEVDVLRDDVGEKRASFAMQTPAAGAAPVVQEREITAGVTEEPSGAGNAVLTLKLRLTLESKAA